MTLYGNVTARSGQGLTTSTPFKITVGTAVRLRLKTKAIELLTSKYYGLINYSHDSLGRLAGLFTQEVKQCFVFYQPGQRAVLKYDQTGRLISVEGLPGGPISYENCLNTYNHDERGNLGSINYYSITFQKPTLALKCEVHFEYNGTRFPTGFTPGIDTILYTYSLSYSHSNFIQQDLVDNQGNKTSFNYRYDTEANFFCGLLKLTEFDNLLTTFSKNNITGNSITNTYDSNGLIIWRVNATMGRTETFEYEP